jgi:DNA-binding NtrC family response regulator
MTLYTYEITYHDGSKDKFEDFPKLLDIDVVKEQPWLEFDGRSWQALIRTEEIRSVRVVARELSEVQSLTYALNVTNNSRSEAAKLLGVSERTLYRKLAEIGLRAEALEP